MAARADAADDAIAVEDAEPRPAVGAEHEDALRLLDRNDDEPYF